MELRDVLWRDWGQPARIGATLREIGGAPNILLDCLGLGRRGVEVQTHLVEVGK